MHVPYLITMCSSNSEENEMKELNKGPVDYREGERGGGLQNGKIVGPKRFAPSPQDRVKLFVPSLQGWKLVAPPPPPPPHTHAISMAKISSVKTISKLFVTPPSAWPKLF